MKTIVSLFLFASFTLSQQFTNWINYTDMKDVKSVFASGIKILAATSGGGFEYNISNQSYYKFNKADGLTGIELTAVTQDKYGKIWFGSNNGVIDIYDTETGVIKSLVDIANSDKGSKSINQLYADGDTIFAATDFGITLINAKSFVFIDTYFKFGVLPSNIKVKCITRTNLLYAGTEAGIALQKPGTTNLSAPESWDVFPQLAPGLSNNANKIVFFEDKLTVATTRGISVFDGNTWQPLINEFNNVNVADLFVKDNVLYIITDNTLYSYSSGNLTSMFSSPSILKSIAYTEFKGILIASNSGVLIVDEEEFYFPNGPAANQFPNITIDPSGNFWSGSGINNAGKGIYKFDGIEWSNLNSQAYPVMINNDYYSIYAAPDNTIYSGNWGQGFVRIKGNDIIRFDANNTNMQGFPGNTNFLLIGGFGVDSRNNLWILNVEAADRNTLAMLTSDSAWYFFSIPAEQNRVLKLHDNLVIDQYDTKWFSSADESRSGVFYFNENKSYNEPADDRSGYLNTQSGLNSNTVNSIVVDRRGDVWVGTGLGINIITNTNTVLSSSPQLRISSVFSVRQQSINAIAVDPLNQKWVGTNQGLVLLNSDGSRLLASFDVKNSPLLSDRIISLTINERNGKVFVGTEEGLTVFDTPAVKPLEAFEELFTFPNPFVISDASDFVTIDGLIRDCNIKILSVTGQLISEFSTPGGRVGYWDGRDLKGNKVNSGVYIIVAFDKDGNSVATGKVAVLRK